jgi:microsomal dipeptidase-like Zn-dependent dipeptidase
MYAEGSQEAGYMPAQIEKMTSGNVIRVLRAAEGAGQEGRLSP